MFGLKIGKRRKASTLTRLVKAATRGARVGAKLAGDGQKREASKR